MIKYYIKQKEIKMETIDRKNTPNGNLTYEFQKIKNFEKELMEDFDYNKRFSCVLVGLSMQKTRQTAAFRKLVQFFTENNEYNVEITNYEIRFKFPFTTSLKQTIYFDQEGYLKEKVFDEIEKTLLKLGFINITSYSRMD